MSKLCQLPRESVTICGLSMLLLYPISIFFGLKNEADFGIWAKNIGFLGVGNAAGGWHQGLQDVPARNSDKSKFVTGLDFLMIFWISW